MTYEHYLQQPKPMIEWRMNLILSKKPQFIKILVNGSHSLLRKYCHLINDDDDDDDVEN